MFNGFCHFGSLGSSASPGAWGWMGMILILVLWVGLLATLALLVVLAVRRTRTPAAAQQPGGMGRVQAQYARGEITREQVDHSKQDVV